MEVKDLAYILAEFGEIIRIQIEVEGMKAHNKEREMNSFALAYDEKAFADTSKEVGIRIDNIRKASLT